MSALRAILVTTRARQEAVAVGGDEGGPRSSHSMSMEHVDLKIPGGTKLQSPPLVTTMLLGYVGSNVAEEDSKRRMSGIQMSSGRIRTS